MRHLSPLLAITLAACVTVPGFSPAEDSGGGTLDTSASPDLAASPDAAAAPDAEAGPDASAGMADADTAGPDGAEEISEPGPSESFPPPPDSLPLLIRDVIVVDLNSDGRDDLVLSNVHADAAAWGLIVILGHTGGVLDAYHELVPSSVQPLGVGVGQALGSSAPDLLVLGPDAQAGGLALVYETLDPGAPTFAAPLEHEVEGDGFPFTSGPLNNPAHIVAAEVTGDGVPDLLVGDFDRVTVVEPSAWTAPGLATAAQRHLTFEDSVKFDHVSRVLVIDHPVTGDRLVVVKQLTSAVSFEVHEGVGVATVGTTAATSSYLGLHRSTPADVDGDGVTDLIGFDYADVRVHKLDPPDGFAVVDWNEPVGRIGPGHYQDITTGDVTGEGSLDVVLLDNNEGQGSDSVLRLLRDVYIADGVLHDTGAHVNHALLPGFHPDLVRIGDFDGDGATEVIALDRAGASACVRWDGSDKALKPCDGS